MTKHLKAPLDWLQTFRRWLFAELKRWGVLLFAIIVSMGMLLVALQPRTDERYIRGMGLILQLMGVGTVAWGVSKTNSQFGHPTLLTKAATSLRRFPRWRRPTIEMISAADTLGLSICEAPGSVRVAPGPNPTLEDRIAALEENLRRIDEELTQTREQIEAKLRGAADALGKEVQARTSGDQATRQLLESTATGGLHITEAGVVWLSFGAVLGTLPAEIAGLLK